MNVQFLRCFLFKQCSSYHVKETALSTESQLGGTLGVHLRHLELNLEQWVSLVGQNVGIAQLTQQRGSILKQTPCAMRHDRH